MESKVKYGQEIGPNLIKLGRSLTKNQNLLMLLENQDLDPLNREKHPNEIDGLKLLNDLIRFVPLLTADEKDDQNVKAKIAILCDKGQPQVNIDNENLDILIYVYCPFEQWLIAGDQLRPFAIMSEIRQSIQDKRINGLGEIKYEGFNLSLLTEEMSAYAMRFTINAFS